MIIKSRTYSTKIDIAPEIREALITLLNQCLADMVDLFNQVKYAHWNVRGPAFIQLHELFDSVAEHVEENCDLLAERAVSLGGVAEGTTRQAVRSSTIGEYEIGAVDGQDHVAALSGQLAKLCASIRAAIHQSAEAGDPTTSDLFTEISRTLDKDLWFLEAHFGEGR